MPKQKRYWLRGGIVGVLIFIVWLGASYISVNPMCKLKPGGHCPTSLELLLSNPLRIFDGMDLSTFSLILIFSFSMGSIFGLIYGKFKNRKSNSSTPLTPNP